MNGKIRINLGYFLGTYTVFCMAVLLVTCVLTFHHFAHSRNTVTEEYIGLEDSGPVHAAVSSYTTGGAYIRRPNGSWVLQEWDTRLERKALNPCLH